MVSIMIKDRSFMPQVEASSVLDKPLIYADQNYISNTFTLSKYISFSENFVFLTNII